MTNDRVRGRVWVSARIQGRILGRIACYWAIYHAVLWNAIFVARYIAYRASLIAGDTEVRTIGQLYATFASDYAGLALCAVLLAPVFLYDVFRQSHRIAGPLVRFQTVLKRMIAGERVSTVKLRKDDLLTEFQDVFNEFIEYYNQKHGLAPNDARMNEREAAILEQVTQVRAAVLQEVESMAAEASSPGNRPWTKPQAGPATPRS
ncbi:hypothetical protein Pan44_05300 [Caulifigura coniformis]|uniref:HAMP domain-containing protein n=1 Tax=Caulifigura coniformis TaxID=2527983 RepID=A0A517S8R2_9PLAN|nr:hypothetical protein [Caulifigura coniformis]QDT52518.1 hypothetical protein Pan44_05300 [Caulifigura coniformis]